MSSRRTSLRSSQSSDPPQNSRRSFNVKTQSSNVTSDDPPAGIVDVVPARRSSRVKNTQAAGDSNQPSTSTSETKKRKASPPSKSSPSTSRPKSRRGRSLMIDEDEDENAVAESESDVYPSQPTQKSASDEEAEPPKRARVSSRNTSSISKARSRASSSVSAVAAPAATSASRKATPRTDKAPSRGRVKLGAASADEEKSEEKDAVEAEAEVDVAAEAADAGTGGTARRARTGAGSALGRAKAAATKGRGRKAAPADVEVQEEEEDETAAASAAMATPAKQSRTPARTPARTPRRKAYNDGGNRLLALCLSDEPMPSVVAAWSGRLRESEAAALAELCSFLVRACGFDRDARGEDDVEAYVAALTAEQPPPTVNPLPTVALSRAMALLARVVALATDPEVFAPLSSLLLDWLIALASSPLRPARLAATQLALSVATTLAAIGGRAETLAAQAMQEAADADARAEGAVGRGQRELAEQARAEAASLERVCEESLSLVEAALELVKHRYRDVDAGVRAATLYHLSVLITAWPRRLLRDAMLRYLAWSLNDAEATVRLAAVSACSRVLMHSTATRQPLTVASRDAEDFALPPDAAVDTAAPVLEPFQLPAPPAAASCSPHHHCSHSLLSPAELLSLARVFVSRFTLRFQSMTNDVDAAVAAAAVTCLALLLRIDLLDETVAAHTPRLLWDSQPRVRHAAALFVFEDTFRAEVLRQAELAQQATRGDRARTDSSAAQEGLVARVLRVPETQLPAELRGALVDDLGQVMAVFLTYSPAATAVTGVTPLPVPVSAASMSPPALQAYMDVLVDGLAPLVPALSTLPMAVAAVTRPNLPSEHRTALLLLLLSMLRRHLTGSAAPGATPTAALAAVAADKRRAAATLLAPHLSVLVESTRHDPYCVCALATATALLGAELGATAQHAALTSALRGALEQAVEDAPMQACAAALAALARSSTAAAMPTVAALSSCVSGLLARAGDVLASDAADTQVAGEMLGLLCRVEAAVVAAGATVSWAAETWGALLQLAQDILYAHAPDAAAPSRDMRWARGRGGRRVLRACFKALHAIVLGEAAQATSAGDSRAAPALPQHLSALALLLLQTLGLAVPLAAHHAPPAAYANTLAPLPAALLSAPPLTSHSLASPAMLVLVASLLAELHVVFSATQRELPALHSVLVGPAVPLPCVPAVIELLLATLAARMERLVADADTDVEQPWFRLDDELYEDALDSVDAPLEPPADLAGQAALPSLPVLDGVEQHLQATGVSPAPPRGHAKAYLHSRSLVLTLGAALTRLALFTAPHEQPLALPAIVTWYRTLSPLLDQLVTHACRVLRARSTGAVVVAKAVARAMMLSVARAETVPTSALSTQAATLAMMCSGKAPLVAEVLCEKAFDAFPQHMSLLSVCRPFLGKAPLEDARRVGLVLGTLARKHDVAAQVSVSPPPAWAEWLEGVRAALEKRGVMLRADVIPAVAVRAEAAKAKRMRTSIVAAAAVATPAARVSVDEDEEAAMGLEMGAMSGSGGRAQGRAASASHTALSASVADSAGEESDTGVASVVSRLNFRGDSESEGDSSPKGRGRGRTRDLFSTEDEPQSLLSALGLELLEGGDIDEESHSQPARRSGRNTSSVTASPGQRGKRKRNDESKGDTEVVTTARRRR